MVEWAGDVHPDHFAVQKSGRPLRHEMEKLTALADDDGDSDDHDAVRANILALPRVVLNTIMNIDSEQQATLSAIIAESFATKTRSATSKSL